MKEQSMPEVNGEQLPVHWPRNQYGEFAFGDEMLLAGIPASLFLVSASGGLVGAFPLPDDLRLTVSLVVGFGTFVLCTAGFIVVPFFLEHRYRNEGIGEAAKTLASLGLLRGRAGRRRRRVLRQLDKDARGVAEVMNEVGGAGLRLLDTGLAEPMLLEELDARIADLELRLHAIVSEAHTFARQEQLNALGTDEQITTAREDAKARTALTHAMRALEQSREVIYQDR